MVLKLEEETWINLCFIDDIILKAKNVKDLQDLVTQIKEHSEKIGLKININLKLTTAGRTMNNEGTERWVAFAF